jgi:hypothetical protein
MATKNDLKEATEPIVSMAYVLAVMTLKGYIALSMNKAYRFVMAHPIWLLILACMVPGSLGSVSEAISARDSA